MQVHKLVVLFLIISVCGACSASKAPNSGFLGDATVYNALKPEPGLDGIWVYRAPGQTKPLGNYDSYILSTVDVYLNAEGQKREISREELNELAMFFRSVMYDEISPAYKITNIPGPRVAIIRMAITDADPNIPALNIHPGSVITGAGLGGATMEAKLIDSQTGELVAALMASSKGKKYNFASGLSKWGHTKALFEDWAKLIRERIDSAHQVG